MDICGVNFNNLSTWWYSFLTVLGMLHYLWCGGAGSRSGGGVERGLEIKMFERGHERMKVGSKSYNVE